MAATEVALYWHCKTPEGWKRYPAAMGRNGKVRPGYAQVGDAQINYPEGRYVLRHTEGRKSIWTPAGNEATHAKAEQMLATSRLVAKRAAQAAGTQIIETSGRVHLRTKSVAYIQRQEARGKLKHFERFRSAIDEFLKSTGDSKKPPETAA